MSGIHAQQLLYWSRYRLTQVKPEMASNIYLRYEYETNRSMFWTNNALKRFREWVLGMFKHSKKNAQWMI